MGHSGYHSILRLPNIVDGIDMKRPDPREICSNCIKDSKQKKPSFEPISQPTIYPEYLHCDLGGLYLTTRKDNRYYPGIRDGAIGACYVKPIRTTGQVFDIFLKFIHQAECQSRKRLKHLHIDFKRKFANQAFEEYTSKEGVKCKPSALYTPDQNGKAERHNYTLMSLICSILFIKHLPKILWIELITTVLYIKNQSLRINDIIPYEIGNYTHPNLSHLKVLGSRAWVYILKDKRVKLGVYS